MYYSDGIPFHKGGTEDIPILLTDFGCSIGAAFSAAVKL